MTTIVDRLDLPALEKRDAIKRGPITLDEFHSSFLALRCLDQIERTPPPAPPEAAPESARILFWNAERLKCLQPSFDLLQRSAADAFLLCEIDVGMARSGNRHMIAEVARALGAGYAYGVEFVELDLGDARERMWHRNETNSAGLHGAGLVSPRSLERPALARLEKSGRWFDGAFGERRVGGRIAVMAELALRGGSVLLVCVHYESHTGPADRLAQTRVLLDAIDRHAPDLPVLIGGDFNTSTFELPTSTQADVVAAALHEDPSRALDAASDHGATVAEIDVVLTRDDAIVLLHDEILDRTTNGKGRVADLDLDSVRRLDAGSWFAPEFSGTRIPTLQEALATARSRRIGLLVEIRSGSANR